MNSLRGTYLSHCPGLRAIVIVRFFGLICASVPETDLRPYVLRLLHSDFSEAAVMHLLLYARERNEGRVSIKEVGDFTAHNNERTRGAIVRDAKAFHGVRRFHHLHPRGTVSRRNFPASVPPLLKTNLERCGRDHLKKRTGLNKSQATKLLKGLLRKFKLKNIGILSATAPLLPGEIALLTFLYALQTSKAVFTDDDLFRDFCAVLQNNGLLDRKEAKVLQKIKAGLYVVCDSSHA